MKRTICLILASVLMLSAMLAFNSCTEDAPKASEIEKGYSYVESYIKENLYDPESLTVKSADGVYIEGEKTIYYKVNFNAKNRLGGYVGYKDHYYSFDIDSKNASVLTLSSSYDLMMTMYKVQERGANLETKYCYEKVK